MKNLSNKAIKYEEAAWYSMRLLRILYYTNKGRVDVKIMLLYYQSKAEKSRANRAKSGSLCENRQIVQKRENWWRGF